MKLCEIKPQISEFMKDADFAWAVCGGYALDLFLNTDLRVHGDVDLCVFERDREKILRYMLEKGWAVYEFRGNGKVRPLKTGSVSDPGRNLMCVKDPCELVRFYPCEEEGVLYHQFFHIGFDALQYLEFLFSAEEDGALCVCGAPLKKALPQAVLHRDGVPYLAPEIALLYKAAGAENPDYRLDFERTVPHLNSEQRAWLRQGLSLLYPAGHIWQKML